MHHVVRTVIVTTCILLATIAIVAYGRGYRLNTKQISLSPTGSLVATSIPNGAKVFVDGTFRTATDSTIQLAPGTYKVRIVKEGYIPWEKELTVRGEVVTQAYATLFYTNPSLARLSSTGVINPVLSPLGDKVVFGREQESTTSGIYIDDTPTPEGLWVLDLADGPLALNRDPRQIARSVDGLPFETARTVWSPTNKQLLALFEEKTEATPTQPEETTLLSAYLLDADRLNAVPQDVTATVDTILEGWKRTKDIKAKEQLSAFPKELVKIAEKTMNVISISPDETKLLYEATASATLPPIITPPLLGTKQTKEERILRPGSVYIYDAKEDKNFHIMDTTQSTAKQGPGSSRTGVSDEEGKTAIDQLTSELSTQPTVYPMWYANSYNLVLPEKDRITVMEYDGSSKTVVYAGPFEPEFIAPWPSGGKIIIMTNLNPSVSTRPHFYLVNIR